MKKSINKPEVKVIKLQKMNVIATSGDTPAGFSLSGDGFQNEGTAWHSTPSAAPKMRKF